MFALLLFSVCVWPAACYERRSTAFSFTGDSRAFHFWDTPADPSIPVPELLLLEDFASDDLSDKLLVRAGIPLRYDISVMHDILMLRETLHFFAGDEDSGECFLPYPDEPIMLYYAMVPEEAEARYGEGRRLLFAPFLLPVKAWSAAMNTSVVPWKRDALAAELRAGFSFDGLGRVTLYNSGMPVVIPLTDITMSGSRLAPYIHVAADGVFKRRRFVDLMESKEAFAKGITLFDTTIKKAVEEVQAKAVLDEAQAKEAAVFRRRMRENWRRYLAAKTASSVAQREREDRESTTAALAAREGAEHRRTACEKIHKALVLSPRLPHHQRQLLRSYQKRYGCSASSAPTEERKSDEQEGHDASLFSPPLNGGGVVSSTTARISPVVQAALCQGARRLAEWKARTTEPPTLTQLFSLLVSLHLHTHPVMERGSGDSSDESDTAATSFSPQLFVAELKVFMESLSSSFSSLPPECQHDVIQADVIREATLLSGIVLLLRTGKDADRTDLALGMCMIQQSAWWGSRQAISTLASMRRTGLFMRQHTGASVYMRQRLLAGYTSHMFRALLRSAASGVGSASMVGAESVLWRERLVFHSFNWFGVNKPSRMLDDLSTFSSVTHDDTSDASTESQYVNFDVPYLTEDVVQNVNTDIILSVSRIVGFRSVDVDHRIAVCELLQGLRRLRFVCDALEPYMVSSIKRSTASCAKESELRDDLMRGTVRKRLSCGITAESNRTHLSAPPTDEQFATLTRALVSLSYLHLIHYRDYGSSFLYAFYAWRYYAAKEAEVRRLASMDATAEMPTPHSLFEVLTLVAGNGVLSAVGGDHATNSFINRKIVAHLKEAYNITVAPHGHPIDDSEPPYVTYYFLLAAAAGRWKDARVWAHSLQMDENDAHRGDPLFLMHYLLHRRLVRTADLAKNAPMFSALFAGGKGTFLPREFDDEAVLAARLDRFTLKQVYQLVEDDKSGDDDGSDDEDGNNGGAAAFEDEEDETSTLNLRPSQLLDSTLSVERSTHTLSTTSEKWRVAPSFDPLLFLSDHQYYITEGGLYFFARIKDAIRYVFTETVSESLLRRLGLSILPPPITDASGVPTRAQNEKLSSPAEFVLDFTEAVSVSGELRDYARAVMLLATTLETAHPTGFAMLFFEGEHKNNAYLAPLLDFISHNLWGWQTAAMWQQQRFVAQWHRENDESVGASGWYTLSAYTPFRFVGAEHRQELMSAVDRWLARGSKFSASQRLAQCAGLRHPTLLSGSPYDGMWFPAANLECLVELYRRASAEDGWAAAAGRELHLAFLALIQDLSSRLRFFYKHTIIRPTDALPPFSDELSPAEGDGRRRGRRGDNASGASPSADGDSGAELNTDKEAVMKFHNSLRVEPWNRIAGTSKVSYASFGAGMLYNLRLHTLSGTHGAAYLKALFLYWTDKFSFLSRLLPFA